jgi:hypothetical protein
MVVDLHLVRLLPHGQLCELLGSVHGNTTIHHRGIRGEKMRQRHSQREGYRYGSMIDGIGLERATTSKKAVDVESLSHTVSTAMPQARATPSEAR